MRQSEDRGMRPAWLVLLLLACGCGGQGQGAPPADQANAAEPAREEAAATSAAAPAAGQLDPCSLLTAAEAQEITGKSFKEGQRNEVSEGICVFESDGPPNFNFAVMPVGADNGADAMLQRFREHGAKITEAPGIGDRSFWAEQVPQMTQLVTYKGAWTVVVNAAFLAGDAAQERAAVVKLMEKVLSRL